MTDPELADATYVEPLTVEFPGKGIAKERPDAVLPTMGVHTGDSITVAPAQTLTDREYQRMRDAARKVMSEIGIETGGSNVQFAVDPKTGRMVIIEMNLRVPRFEGFRR